MKKYIGMALLLIAGIIAHVQPEIVNIAIVEIIQLFAGEKKTPHGVFLFHNFHFYFFFVREIYTRYYESDS